MRTEGRGIVGESCEGATSLTISSLRWPLRPYPKGQGHLGRMVTAPDSDSLMSAPGHSSHSSWAPTASPSLAREDSSLPSQRSTFSTELRSSW